MHAVCEVGAALQPNHKPPPVSAAESVWIWYPNHNALPQRSVEIRRHVSILLIFGNLLKQLTVEFLTKLLVAQECEPFQTAMLCPEWEIGLRKPLRKKVSQNYLLKQCVITCLL